MTTPQLKQDTPNIELKRSKIATIAALCTIGLAITPTTQAQTLSDSVDTLLEAVEYACPNTWEDLGEKIPENLPSIIWGNSTDQANYATYYANLPSTPDSLSDSQRDAALADNETIISECTSARTKLLSKYYSNLPQDVVAAMSELDYEPGDIVDGFEIGDIRFTTRLEPADGWFFITHNQTIGRGDSNATLNDDDFETLFNIAKRWPINTDSNGTVVKNWGSHIAKLPNLTSRAIIPTAVGTHATYGVGKEFGAASREASVPLPIHNHTTDSKGAHTPSTKSGTGGHGHNVRVSVYDGSNRTDYGTYFEGKGRPGYERTLSAPIQSSTHGHAMNPVPGHTHTTLNKGVNGAKITYYTSQPSIYLKAEMKYK